jgi:hypothetical protein
MEIIELKCVILTLRDDGILHIHIRSRATMKIQDAHETLQAMKAIGGGNKFPVLIDAGEFASVDPEVRVFSASEEGNIYSLADAIAYHSFAQKLVSDFYISNNKPVIPTRSFPEIPEAIEWLRTFVKKPAV